MLETPPFRQSNAEFAVFFKVPSDQRKGQIAEADHRRGSRRRLSSSCGESVKWIESVFGTIMRVESVPQNVLQGLHCLCEMEENIGTDIL